MRKGLLSAVLAFSCLTALSQQAMNNSSIIKMVKARLSDDLILTTIKSQPGNYDTSADGIIALKAAGTSDKVVAAILAKAAESAAPQAPPASSSPAVSAQAPSTPAAPFHSTDGKIRIYVTEHPSFDANGAADPAAETDPPAENDPRTLEVQADMQKVCPPFIIASNFPGRSDYVLVFRRGGNEKSSFIGSLEGLALSGTTKVDGASLFQNTGDIVYATKENTVEKAIRDVCEHVPMGAQTPATAASASQTQVPSPIADSAQSFAANLP